MTTERSAVHAQLDDFVLGFRAVRRMWSGRLASAVPVSRAGRGARVKIAGHVAALGPLTPSPFTKTETVLWHARLYGTSGLLFAEKSTASFAVEDEEGGVVAIEPGIWVSALPRADVSGHGHANDDNDELHHLLASHGVECAPAIGLIGELRFEEALVFSHDEVAVYGVIDEGGTMRGTVTEPLIVFPV
jgi:hypothetical protein